MLRYLDPLASGEARPWKVPWNPLNETNLHKYKTLVNENCVEIVTFVWIWTKWCANLPGDSCELMVRAGLFSGITIYYYYNRKNSKYIKRIHSSMKYILLFAYAFCIISMYLRMLDALLYVSQLPSLHTTSVGACIIENFFVNSACSSASTFS